MESKSEQKVNSPSGLNDVLFFLVAIPIINAYNYYLTYTNIKLNWFAAYTYGIDTLMGYAAWWTMRWLTVFLDRPLPYAANPGKRIVGQVLITTAAGLLVIIICTNVMNALLRDHPVPVSFYQYDILIFIIWFLVINGIYTGLHFYTAWKGIQQSHPFQHEGHLEEKPASSESFIVRSGRQAVTIDVRNVLGFYVDGDYTAVVTTKQKKYLLDQSLDKIEQTIPWEAFFRLNRQFILSRQAIKGFERLENGKLRVLLHAEGPFPLSIQVSRFKAPSFKSWFKLV